jgi:hypothetical protein
MKPAKKKILSTEDRLERGIKTAIAALNATLIVVSLKKALKKRAKQE